jgi:hypothetical protein
VGIGHAITRRIAAYNAMMSDPHAQSDPAAALEAVVDDATPREEALRFAIASLEAGDSFESTTAALIGAGWSSDDAEAIVEDARQQTRAARGVTTLADVRRQNDRTRHATRVGRWTAGFPLLSAVLGLRRSLVRLLTAGRDRRDR